MVNFIIRRTTILISLGLAAVLLFLVWGTVVSAQEKYDSVNVKPANSMVAASITIVKDSLPADGTNFTLSTNALPFQSYQTQWGSQGNGDGQFDLAEGVAVDKVGNVYISDTENHRIQKFDSSGNYLDQWGSEGGGAGQFEHPRGIAADEDNNIYIVDSNNHRVQKFDSDGNYLDLWGSNGSGNGQFNFPEGVAVDEDNNVYITDLLNHRIQKFDTSGNYLDQWGSNGGGDGQFDFPTGVAVDDTGNVFVVDTNNDRIQKFDSNGNYLIEWGSTGSGNGQFIQPWAIAVDGAGNVYVSDPDNHRIQKFDSNGNYLNKWGSFGTSNGEFNFPFGVAVDGTGNIYVVDTVNYRIQKFSTNLFVLDDAVPDDGDTITDTLTNNDLISGTYSFTETLPTGWALDDIICDNGSWVADLPTQSLTIDLADNESITCTFKNVRTSSITIIKDAEPTDGTDFTFSTNAMTIPAYLLQWGNNGSSNGQFDLPDGITIDGVGNVYVVDTNNARIQKFDSNGNYLDQWGSFGSSNGQFDFPTGIAVDGSGNVYVTDSSNNRLQKFDSNGTYLQQWGTFGSGNGQFDFPEGIAVDGFGNVYIVDFNNHRVQKFDSNGTYLGQWGIFGSGNGQFNSPINIAVDGSGNIYVVDFFNYRIQKFTSNGTYQGQWGSFGNGPGQFIEPWAVAVDDDGNVYVTDGTNDRVQIFDSGGSYLDQWGSSGNGDGQFSFPTGIVVDEDENIYVVDQVDNRVQKFATNLFVLDDAIPDDNDANTDTLTISNLLSGTHSFMETLPVGWDLDDIDCDGGSWTADLPNQALTINLATGENITCTFRNILPLNLQLSKDDGGIAAVPGDTISYTLTYSNAIGSPATGVVITETIPANTTFNPAASTTGWVCTPDNSAGSTCTFAIGSVASGTGGSVTFAVDVASPLPSGIVQIDNMAVIGDDGTNGPEQNPADNTDSDSTPVQAAPDLVVSKDDGGISAQPGDTVTYTLVFGNTGNQGATGVTLTETVPADTTFNPAASTAGWACIPNNNPGSICTLAIGSTAGGGAGSAVFFAIDIDNPYSGGSLVTNTAIIQDDGTNGPDQNPADNNASDSTPVDAPPEILSISITPPIINENESADLNVTLEDIGQQESHLVVIDWGDGLTQTLNLVTGTLIFSASHPYLDDNPTGTPSDVYTVSVTITEPDNDTTSDNTTLTVNNVVPSVSAQANSTAVSVSEQVDFTGVFTDVGTLDTHTIVWNFGDGVTATGSLTTSHVYTMPGTYDAILTVTDDDGGVGSDQVQIMVEAQDAVIYLPAVLSAGNNNTGTVNTVEMTANATHLVRFGWHESFRYLYQQNLIPP